MSAFFYVDLRKIEGTRPSLEKWTTASPRVFAHYTNDIPLNALYP